ncbi:MAG: MgtC/SapB family protein, partial [Candidatus Gracilibacteria bacterium]
MYLDLLQQFGTALALSFLIGLEREQKKQSLKNLSFAGVRSFVLIGLLGALAFSFMKVSVVLSASITAVVFALLVASYIVIGVRSGRIGITTEVAAVVTYLIGGLCVNESYIFAVGLTLVTLAVLYFKVP